MNDNGFIIQVGNVVFEELEYLNKNSNGTVVRYRRMKIMFLLLA